MGGGGWSGVSSKRVKSHHTPICMIEYVQSLWWVAVGSQHSSFFMWPCLRHNQLSSQFWLFGSMTISRRLLPEGFVCHPVLCIFLLQREVWNAVREGGDLQSASPERWPYWGGQEAAGGLWVYTTVESCLLLSAIIMHCIIRVPHHKGTSPCIAP